VEQVLVINHPVRDITWSWEKSAHRIGTSARGLTFKPEYVQVFQANSSYMESGGQRMKP
jgi:hypothetical protein